MDGHLILSAARRAVLNHGALLLSTHQGVAEAQLVGSHGAREEAAAEREAAEGATGAEGQALHHPSMRCYAPLLD
nr:unnamed protein product [Digitaria exilis]